MSYPFCYGTAATNSLLDLMHAERDAELRQHEARTAELHWAQEMAIALPTVDVNAMQHATIASPVGEPAALPRPTTQFVDLTYQPRQRPPRQPRLKRQSQQPNVSQEIDPEKQYKIWVSMFVNRVTFTETARIAGVSRSTCHKYVKRFSGNPPMEAIALYNLDLYNQIMHQRRLSCQWH